MAIQSLGDSQIGRLLGFNAPLPEASSSLSVTGIGTPYSVPVANYQGRFITLTGALTANQVLTFPLAADASSVNMYVINNQTTGSFTVTIQGATGAGAVVPQSKRTFIGCDNTNFFLLTAGE